LIANYSYDFLRRPTLAAIVGGSSTSTSYDDVNFKTTSTTTIDSSKSVQQISAADTLGRTLTTTLEDGTGSVKSVVKNEYDLAGRAYGVSNPYTTGNPVYSTTSFDVLGRVTSVTAPAPDSSITGYTYSTNTITVKDPTGKQRQSVFDAAGRLSAVYEPDATTGLLTVPTLYKYTVLDQLATVASAPSNPDQTRTYNYDGLGRLTATVTPEGGTTCFGTKTGSTCNTDGYSPFDQLLTRTDARGVVTSYGYDGLNRLNSVSYNVGSTGVPATSTISLTYGLDSSCTSAHGSGCIGQIITMTDGPGSENYTYNSLEQLTQLQKVIGSTTYTTQYAYNLAGELTTITYPSGRSIAQNLDTIGRLSSIVGTLNSVQTTYASGYGYSPASQLTGFQYGNGIYASLGFTSDRLQLNCVDYSTTNRNGTCTHDSSTKFGLDYSYGAAGSNNGQIQGITDRVDNGRSATYAYDGLARLYTAATTGSASYPAWGLKETYDRYGNRWSQTAISGCTGQTCPQPSVSFNLASNHINTSGYGYDTNGNLTNDGQNTLVYDAENHATSSSGSLGSGTYTYDGNGLRVKKVSGSTTTVYIFSGSKVIAEYDNGAAVGSPSREYISGGSALLAKIDSTGTKYYHQDHLSNRLVTDSSGNKLAEIGHFPFGESWYNATSDKLQFTTYERDAESGNDYAQARYYVSRLGRFSSLDPLPGSTGNPQTLNHYVYALNDPVNGVDPSGLLLVYLSWLLGDGSLQSGFFDSVDLQNAGFDIQFDSNGNIANITAPDFNVAVLNGNGDQVGVIGPDTDLTAGTVQLQQSVTVYASVDSPATISSPVSGQFVELPAVDAGPMAPSAKRMLRAIAAASPTVCGGGFFIYAGYQGAKEFGRVEGEGFVGYLGEWDSNSGWSNNGLVEGGFVNPATGRGVAVGGSGNTTSGPEWLLFVPASPGGGGVMGPSSIGAYVGTPKNGPGVGVGGYVNIMPSATCSAVRAQNSNRGTGGGGGF
jgi:RHS repeat-associated protein